MLSKLRVMDRSYSTRHSPYVIPVLSIYLLYCTTYCTAREKIFSQLWLCVCKLRLLQWHINQLNFEIIVVVALHELVLQLTLLRSRCEGRRCVLKFLTSQSFQIQYPDALGTCRRSSKLHTRFQKIVQQRIPIFHLANSQRVMMTMRQLVKEYRGPGYTRSTALCSLRLKPHTRH